MGESENIRFCPLCGSTDIRILKSRNFRCHSCQNSFVAKKRDASAK